MKRISNRSMLESYLEKYNLNEIFEENMIEYMELFSFSKGELVCSKYDKLNYMYFLVEGKIKIYILQEDGKSVLLRFNKPLSILGDVEFLTDYKVMCNAEPSNDVILIGILIDDLHTHAYNNAKFLRFIIKNLSHKLYTTSNAVSLNLLYPVESRLASYLLSVNEGEDIICRSDEIRTTKLTELATLLGTSYRHLNRIVNELVTKDIIEKNRGIITIKNLKKLKELANENLYE